MYSPDLPDFPPPDCAGCQIGGIEVAGAIRAGLRGELPVRRLSDAGIADCTSGDAFEFQVGDYVVVGFVDDPGAVDYIAEVRHGDRDGDRGFAVTCVTLDNGLQYHPGDGDWGEVALSCDAGGNRVVILDGIHDR